MLFQLSALAFILCIHCENIQGDQLKNSSSNSSSHGAQPDHPPKNVASDDHTATKRPIDEQIDLKRATSHRHLVVEHDDFTAYIVEADYTENPVNGQWSRWTDSDCLGSCGVGNRLRIRTCTEPPPQYGGVQCEGPAMQTVACMVDNCSVNGQWSRWTESDCLGPCGAGYRLQMRTCTEPPPQYGGEQCEGPAMQTVACMVDNCSVNGGIWSPWMVGPCSVSCGNGTTIMTRTCQSITPRSDGNACTGADEESVLCKELDCAVDGAWTAWVDFGSSSVTCEMGSKTQKRWCNAPSPSNGGANCTGNLTRNVACNETAYPPPQVWDIRMKTQFIHSAPQVRVLEIDLNGTAIPIPPSGTCTAGGRGLTIVSVDKNKALVEQITCEDTHTDGGGAARLIAFLDTVPVGNLVLCISHDEVSKVLGAEFNKYMITNYHTQLLKGIDYRDNWMLIAIKGVGTLHEELAKAVGKSVYSKKAPPVEIKATVTKGSDQIAVTRTI